MKKVPALALALLLLFTGVLPAQVSDPKSSTLPEVKTYDQLLDAIRKARAASEARIQAAVEQEKVREAWETGKLIDEHILQHKERADYGAKVLKRLSVDLGTSDRELYYMLAFFRAYPILTHASKLTWSDYRELLAVNEQEKREALAGRAEKEHWNRSRLRSEVKAAKQKEAFSSPASTADILAAKPGIPGTYRYVKATVGLEAGKGMIDLGFSNWYRTSKNLGYADGAIIETLPAFPESSSPSDKIRLSKRTEADLYTYRAWIVEALDGDTVKAVVDLGFGVRSVQVLRLRGIDAPELLTGAGKEAKAFVEKTLAATPGAAKPFLIKTSKSDKYDRYLVDIFVNGIYVNKALLNEGLAVKVEGE